MRQIGKKQPIAGIGRRPPVHRVTVGTKALEEKVPPSPYTRKFVDPDGMVKRVVLATGRTIGGTVDNPYGNMMWADKLEKGWLPYAECPVGKYLTLPGETPCAGTGEKPGIFYKRHPNNPHAFIEDECCPHIELAIRERRADHEERQDEYKKQFVNSMDKLVQHMEAQMARESNYSEPEQRAAAIFGTESPDETAPRSLSDSE